MLLIYAIKIRKLSGKKIIFAFLILVKKKILYGFLKNLSSLLK